MKKSEVIFLYDMLREIRRGLSDPGIDRDDLVEALDEAVTILEWHLTPEERKYEN